MKSSKSISNPRCMYTYNIYPQISKYYQGNTNKHLETIDLINLAHTKYNIATIDHHTGLEREPPVYYSGT